MSKRSQRNPAMTYSADIRFCLCLQESVSQSCVSSGSSMAGLMATSSKRVDVIPSSAAPRAPAPETSHC